MDSMVESGAMDIVVLDSVAALVPKAELEGDMGDAHVGIQARISDAQWEDDLNTLRLRPYFTMDATGAYRIRKNLEVFAAAENIFNSRYDIGLTPVRTVAAPAFVRAGLRLRLGGK